MRRSTRTLRQSAARWIAAAAALAALGCSAERIAEPSHQIDAAIAQVAWEGGTANVTLVPDSLPAATADAPTVTVESPAVLGGSVRLTASSATPFNHVRLAVDQLTGYWDVVLPTSVTSANFIVTLTQQHVFATIPATLSTDGSAPSAGASAPITVLDVGTGEVQVSVAWNVDSDVDLHVVDPNNEEIFYGHPQATHSQGQLDLDSDAACNLDHKKNENVTWPLGHAPHGTYTVRLDHWRNCFGGPVNWIVTVRVQGQNPQTFTGTFTGAGDAGGEGSGTTVTTFTY